MQACQFYVASFWLLPVSFDVFMPPPTINPSQIPPILRHIATTSGAEAVFKSNCFELHGLEAEVRAAVHLVLELEFVKVSSGRAPWRRRQLMCGRKQAFHHEIRSQIELANEHREFISGKKNGKLNKIMKSANVKIKFETFNDYNFLIDVAGSDTGSLHGLTMLQEELPAEISFHVPEAYHKRIIGVGGKNIQRIMKKFGVYVKFSNAEEFAALGGYADNEDNVVARTPAKNAINLEHLKQSVMELVSPKDKDFVVETVSIPRRYHRTLLGEKSIFIHDIESKTNSAVRFPNKETASDIVAIFGPESQVHIAAQMLLDHVPFEACVPFSSFPSELSLIPMTSQRVPHASQRRNGRPDALARLCQPRRARQARSQHHNPALGRPHRRRRGDDHSLLPQSEQRRLFGDGKGPGGGVLGRAERAFFFSRFRCGGADGRVIRRSTSTLDPCDLVPTRSPTRSPSSTASSSPRSQAVRPLSSPQSRSLTTCAQMRSSGRNLERRIASCASRRRRLTSRPSLMRTRRRTRIGCPSWITRRSTSSSSSNNSRRSNSSSNPTSSSSTPHPTFSSKLRLSTRASTTGTHLGRWSVSLGLALRSQACSLFLSQSYSTTPGYPNSNSTPFPSSIPQANRLSHDEPSLNLKRASDTPLDETLKEVARKPRTLGNRAQSLDLSQHQPRRGLAHHQQSVEEVSSVLSQLGLN